AGDPGCEIIVPMAARTTLNAINAEFARRGYHVSLEKAAGYFYFHSGEAADWLDRTVKVDTVNALTFEQGGGGFERLKNLNQEIMGNGAQPASEKPKGAK